MEKKRISFYTVWHTEYVKNQFWIIFVINLFLFLWITTFIRVIEHLVYFIVLFVFIAFSLLAYSLQAVVLEGRDDKHSSWERDQ